MLSRMHFFLRERVFRCRKIERSWIRVYRFCRLNNQDSSQRLLSISSFCNLVLPTTRCKRAGPPSCRCCGEVRLARSPLQCAHHPERPEHYPNVLCKAELFVRARALTACCMVPVRSHERGVVSSGLQSVTRVPTTYVAAKDAELLEEFLQTCNFTSQATPTMNSNFEFSSCLHGTTFMIKCYDYLPFVFYCTMTTHRLPS